MIEISNCNYVPLRKTACSKFSVTQMNQSKLCMLGGVCTGAQFLLSGAPPTKQGVGVEYENTCIWRDVCTGVRVIMVCLLEDVIFRTHEIGRERKLGYQGNG
jgi:hypothetical protein